MAGDVPIPLSEAVCVPASSVMEKVPLRVPEAVGVKAIATVQPVLGREARPAGIGGNLEIRTANRRRLQRDRCSHWCSKL